MSKVAACLYVRNAEHDIQEWIAYHCVIGIQSFLIYDNGSTDATVAQAQKMASVADIRIIPWDQATGINAQAEAYTNCFRQFQREFEWILVIDSDEFLNNTNENQIDSLLNKHFFHAAIAFNWACFGSNGHVEAPIELTTKAFTRRSDETFGPNRHTKIMVRPELVKNVVNPHYFNVDGPIKRPNCSDINWKKEGVTENVELSDWYINHYFVRSHAQWERKLARGYRDGTIRDKNLFSVYDRNEVIDQTAAARTDVVKTLLEQAKCVPQLREMPSKIWFARLLGFLQSGVPSPSEHR